MITVLTGSNDYARREAVRAIRAAFSGDAELHDGVDIDAAMLFNLAQATTLFASDRLVIIRGLAANTALWPELESWLANVNETTHIVLDEPTLDKRSKTYKWLQKNADIKVFDEWTRRDERTAITWCERQAKARGFSLAKPLAVMLVQRAGVDQWRLAAALDKLELAAEITPQTIEQIVEPHLEENVFELFGAALSGEASTVERMLATLSQTDDAYRVFALIASQAIQLAALITSSKTPGEVAQDIKASPYVLGKLAAHAKGKTNQDAAHILEVLARADRQMKSTGVDPWAIVASALLALKIPPGTARAV